MLFHLTLRQQVSRPRRGWRSKKAKGQASGGLFSATVRSEVCAPTIGSGIARTRGRACVKWARDSDLCIWRGVSILNTSKSLDKPFAPISDKATACCLPTPACYCPGQPPSCGGGLARPLQRCKCPSRRSTCPQWLKSDTDRRSLRFIPKTPGRAPRARLVTTQAPTDKRPSCHSEPPQGSVRELCRSEI